MEEKNELETQQKIERLRAELAKQQESADKLRKKIKKTIEKACQG